MSTHRLLKAPDLHRQVEFKLRDNGYYTKFWNEGGQARIYLNNTDYIQIIFGRISYMEKTDLKYFSNSKKAEEIENLVKEILPKKTEPSETEDPFKFLR